MNRGPGGRASCLRERDPERRALPWRRLYLNFAIVHLNGPVDHRETDAAAAVLGREIQIENPLQMLGFDADAGVGKGDEHTMATYGL